MFYERSKPRAFSPKVSIAPEVVQVESCVISEFEMFVKRLQHVYDKQSFLRTSLVFFEQSSNIINSVGSLLRFFVRNPYEQFTRLAHSGPVVPALVHFAL